MFMTALFTISKIWNQPRHSSSGWMMDKKNVVHNIHIRKHYSTFKKKEILKLGVILIIAGNIK
jgi:hypothetical protein